VANEWNAITDDVVQSGTVAAFKRKLAHHLTLNQGI